MKKSELLVLKKHWFLMVETTVRTKQWLNECCSDSYTYTKGHSHVVEERKVKLSEIAKVLKLF